MEEKRALDMSKGFTLFDTLGAKVKWPRVKLYIPTPDRPYGEEIEEIEFKVLGDKSATPGAMVITDGKPYGHNAYYGRIYREGYYMGPYAKLPRFVVDAIRSFATDPEKAIKSAGLASGYCSICRKRLTDRVSIRAGVGPVCAKNAGIPWG